MTEGHNKPSPIPHTSHQDEILFANAEFKKIWDDLDEEYAALWQLLRFPTKHLNSGGA